MRTFALLTTIVLAFAAFPYVAGQTGTSDPGAAPAGEPTPMPGAPATDPLVAELLARIAALEQLLADLAGAGTEGGAVGEPCTPSVGCVKLPLYVDEDGDTMTGDLEMSGVKIKFIPNGPTQSLSAQGADDALQTSVLGPEGFDIRTPTFFSQDVKLNESATLNTTGGAKLFVDFDGNLTFADGSFMNPSRTILNQAVTFTDQVFVNKNITIVEGGNIIFQNNTGIFEAGNFTRIGTTTNNPFYVIANDRDAMVFWPGPGADDAVNVVAGHQDNNITNVSDRGNFIAGGGSTATPNVVAGDYNFIMGGLDNTVLGNWSAAGGQGAYALHNNTFVWNDGGAVLNSSGANMFLVNATGGFGIGTDAPNAALTVNGDITPSTTGNRALGSDAFRWHQLFMASQIDFVNELLYTSGGNTALTISDTGNVTLPGTLNAGKLVGDASGLTGIGASALADGSITAPKLAAASVTGDKLAFSCADGEVLKRVAGAWACAVDVDTSETYTAGAGLLLASNEFSIDYSTAQARVTGACSTGSMISSIAQDGTVSCETDADTTYTGSSGIVLTGSDFAPDLATLQARVTGTCAAGSMVASIAQDGTVGCVAPSGDADTLDGLDSSKFLRSDVYAVYSGSQFNAIGSGGITIAHNLSVGTNSGTDNDIIYFDHGDNNEQIGWFDSLDHFWVSDDLDVDGVVTADSFSGNGASLTGVDADLLGGRTSGQYLRSDATDTFSSGTLIVSSGASLSIGSGATILMNGLISGDLIPTSTNNFNIGSSSARYADLYLGDSIDYLSGLQFVQGGTSRASLSSAGQFNIDDDLHVGTAINTDDDTIWFDGDAAFFGWQESPGRFRTNQPLYVPRIGMGVAETDLWPASASYGATSPSGYGAVKGAGALGPTNGYLGVQGGTDFDGITTADWSGREIGVVGISTGASNADNYGVFGHSNGVGVRGESSLNSTIIWGELGTSAGVGVRGMGAPYAGEFLGGLRASGASYLEGDLFLGGPSAVDDEFIYMDTGTAEYLQWDDSEGRFRLSDDLVLAGGLETAGDLNLAGWNIRGGGGTTSSLAIISNYDVVTYLDDDANSGSEWARWYSNAPTLEERMRLDSVGNLRIDGTLTQNGVDIAERFMASEAILPGQVVRLDPAHPGRVLLGSNTDAGVLGVVSTAPGVLLDPLGIPTEAEIANVWGADVFARYVAMKPALRAAALALEPSLGTAKGESSDEKLDAIMRGAFIEEVTVPIALAGRVPVQADATLGGPIAPGDALQASPVPGMAMKADGTGPVIGTALDGLAVGVGNVLTFVTPAPAAQDHRVVELEQTVQAQAAKINDLESRLNALAALVASMQE